MSQKKKVGDLEIDQDLDFQKKEWRVERIGWVIMGLILLAGLFGLFGQGPLSAVTAGNNPLEVTYGRFERLLSPVAVEIQALPADPGAQDLRVMVDRDWLSNYQVSRISPEPDSIELTPDTQIFVFKVNQAGQPLQITFDLQPQKIGMHRGQIGLENGPEVQLNQFVYP